MAGLTAAKRFQDLGINYTLIESSDRVGGRIRSTEFGNYTIEDHANWLSPDNKAIDLATEYGLKITRNRFDNFKIYEYGSGWWNRVHDLKFAYKTTKKKWLKAFRCVLRRADAAYSPPPGPISRWMYSEMSFPRAAGSPTR
jgi:phytoene dehydrogenase-like protein